MSESAWKWGAYRKGMGKDGDDRRIKYAVTAIKQELLWLGVPGSEKINQVTTIFGPAVHQCVKELQRANGLVDDGMVGRATANALFRDKIKSLQRKKGILNNWLRAQVHWESGDDPGAEFINSDGSADRGLCQLNSTRKPLTEEQAFDPTQALTFLADHIRFNAMTFDDCEGTGRFKLAVAAWRTPVGARQWCENPELQGEKDPSDDDPLAWGKRAVYYVGRVDTDGRKGWVG